MANVTVGPQDWQNVAMSYANENINLKAQLAALARTINEMEQANAGKEREATEASGSRSAAEAPGQEDPDRHDDETTA